MIDIASIKSEDILIVNSRILTHREEVHVFKDKLCRLIRPDNNYTYLYFLDPEIQRINIDTAYDKINGWLFAEMNWILDIAEEKYESISPGRLYINLLEDKS